MSSSSLSFGLKREAAYNLALIYRTSGYSPNPKPQNPNPAL
jgi:hypothetical protein